MEGKEGRGRSLIRGGVRDPLGLPNHVRCTLMWNRAALVVGARFASLREPPTRYRHRRRDLSRIGIE